IKVEDPSVGGDVGRTVPPYTQGEDSLFFESFNRNKLSISLDMATPEGRAVFEDLVREADAVYSNLRGDVPAKLRITYDDLKHINPAIVCCSLSGFGMTGPRVKEPGYDYILQGLAGWMSVGGEPGGPPQKTGLSMVDYSGGLVAAIALISGIHAARRDGVGMDCDVSLYDTAISMLTYLATWHLTAGHEPKRTRRSAHPSLVPFQAFPAKDGWLVIGCAKEKFWQRLAKILDREDLLEDPRFRTFPDRAEHHQELEQILDAELARRSDDEWLTEMRAAAIPCAPINSIPQALADEHTAARDMVIATEHPVFGTVRQAASPVRVGGYPAAPLAAPQPDETNAPALTHPLRAGADRAAPRRAPQRGEPTESLLRDLLGYSPEQIDRIRASGAFGTD